MQRFERARVVNHPWDDAKGYAVMSKYRASVCPYYFVIGEEVKLSGILATLVPADKKILHGMSMLLPCGGIGLPPSRPKSA